MGFDLCEILVSGLVLFLVFRFYHACFGNGFDELL